MITKLKPQKFSIKKKYYNDPLKTIHQLDYYLFTNDSIVTSSIINGIQYHPYFETFLDINKIDLSGKVVIDAGANLGSFTIDFAIMVGDSGEVYAFEPQITVFSQLVANVFINGITNVRFINAALGNKSGLSYIEKNNFLNLEIQANYGNTHIIDENYKGNRLTESHSIITITIDELFKEYKEPIKLIKIDVQGYELNILKGGLETIDKFKPIIFLEIEDEQLALYDINKNDIFRELDNLGYKYQKFFENNPYVNDYVCYHESETYLMPKY